MNFFRRNRYCLILALFILSFYSGRSICALAKNHAVTAYEKYSFLLTKGFERNDENILLDATRYMLDWQSEFEKDAPIFQNYQKFRDDWDAILKSYGFVKR